MMVADTSVTTSRRRRPIRPKVFPPTRKQLLDLARRDALSLALGGINQSGALVRYDCGSLPAPFRWFCVQTRPGYERVAAAEIRNQGFLVFVPVGIVTRHRRFAVRPGMPRYVFVAFDPAVDNWRPITGTPGVSRLFMFGDFTPAPVSRCDEVYLQALAETVRVAIGQPDPTAPPVLANAAGQVVDGPFAGFRCVAQGVEVDGRIAVTVEIFGRASRITLERDQVRMDGGKG